MIVVLMGYMGAGKTSVGKELAKELGYRFVDLDAYIVRGEGVDIADLFRTRGELYFRSIESKYLLELLKNENNLVLALGGGTPCYGTNLKLLKSAESVKSVYLKMSIPNLVERLFKDKLDRPLIAHVQSETQLTEFIGKHLFERGKYYSESDVIIDCNFKTINQIIDDIKKRLV
jgi:shikimate kinase